MLGTATGKDASLTETRARKRNSAKIVTRKIWLPKLMYDALPVFYLVSGIAAFLTTLYISEWFWVLPHYILFSAACLHLGIAVYRRRRRSHDDA
ncbi:MAG: hypothetical protein QNJ11_12970 [Woeseiaceae bacterium]|nr:hypothetical protein [Woeseiaceae bacterium]